MTDEITRLKAEIFDLQVELSRIRNLIEAKLTELNKLKKESKNGLVQ